MSYEEITELSEMELWRLADMLSVCDAAMLIAGYSPGDRFFNQDGHLVFCNDLDGSKGRSFDAAFKSLRNAILQNRLPADVKCSLRGKRMGNDPFTGEEYEIAQLPHEEQISYGMLIGRIDTSQADAGPEVEGKTRLNFSSTELLHENSLYVCREPNWEETLIDVEVLKAWLKSRGVFPSGVAEGFRDKNHPRYSAKLACAVAAWEAIQAPQPNKSPKQTLADWIQSNGVNYGLGTDGVVSLTAAEEVAKIANWATSGGATATAANTEPRKTINMSVGNADSEVPF